MAGPDNTRFLLVTVMEEEPPHLLEWVAHHRAIGFTDIAVFTDKTHARPAPGLVRLARIGAVQHIEAPHLRRGLARAALRQLPDLPVYRGATGCLFLESHEFLNPKADRRDKTAIRSLLPDTCTRIPIKVFGRAGAFRSEDLLTAQCTSTIVAEKPSFRAFFRPSHVSGRLGPNGPKLNPSGPAARDLGPDEAVVHAYLSKRAPRGAAADNSIAAWEGAVLAELSRLSVETGPDLVTKETHLSTVPPTPIRRRENRRRLLSRMPKGGRAAEIGVWAGDFAADILEITEPSELVLIDPWELLSKGSGETWTNARHGDAEFMAGLANHVAKRFAGNGVVHIRQGFSEAVLPAYPDDYFDWVYVDGCHLYDAVRGDLALAFRKVKPGGYIIGDDYFWKRDGRAHVRDAVQDALRAAGRPGELELMTAQYIIRV